MVIVELLTLLTPTPARDLVDDHTVNTLAGALHSRRSGPVDEASTTTLEEQLAAIAVALTLERPRLTPAGALEALCE